MRYCDDEHVGHLPLEVEAEGAEEDGDDESIAEEKKLTVENDRSPLAPTCCSPADTAIKESHVCHS